MEDERHGSGPCGVTKGSPGSPFSKTTTTTNTNNNNNNNNNNKNDTTSNSNKEQDRFLPIANVGRIMKKVIPGNGKISKDAKETVQECVSEFISFVTGEASDKCQREKRKTINGEDILYAITILGFEDYVGPLKLYLNKYRELEGEKLNNNNNNNFPKHQRDEQQRLQPQDHSQNLQPYCSVYSSTNIIPHPSFVPNDQTFALPFTQTSMQMQMQMQTQMQLHHQEQIDSVGNW